MTSFDLIVFIIVGVAAIGGFMRGLVQEVLSLASWFLAVFAIHFLHTPLYTAISPYTGYSTPTAILCFVLLLLVPYAAMKLIAGNVGKASRNSLLGPIDRVLGFGFGAIKGALIVILAFSLLVLGYDTIWGVAGRPAWITTSRTYPVIDSSTNAMVQMVDQRRAALRGESDGDGDDESDANTDVIR